VSVNEQPSTSEKPPKQIENQAENDLDQDDEINLNVNQFVTLKLSIFIYFVFNCTGRNRSNRFINRSAS
jgi:hypothetical protein